MSISNPPASCLAPNHLPVDDLDTSAAVTPSTKKVVTRRVPKTQSESDIFNKKSRAPLRDAAMDGRRLHLEVDTD